MAQRPNPWAIGGALPSKGRDQGEPPKGFDIGYAGNATSLSPNATPVLITDAPWLEFNGYTYLANAPVGAWSQVVASNPQAKYLIVQNQHATDSCLIFVGTPASLTVGIIVTAGGYYEWNDHVPVNGVWATSKTANAITLGIISG